MLKNIDPLNIPKKKLQELRKMGYLTTEDVSNNGIVLDKVGLDADIWKGINETPPTRTAADLFDEETNKNHISTGNRSLDMVLKDELVPGKVIEICGLPGSGKTQTCLQLSIAVQLWKLNDGRRGESVFLNTNKNFASHRLREFAEEYCHRFSEQNEDNFGKCVESVMKCIHYMAVDTLVKMFACLNLLDSLVKKHNVKIIIIDSISYLLKQIHLSNRVASGHLLLRRLLKTAQDNEITVIVTNDMTTRVDLKTTFTTPSLGESFFHAVNSRILMSKKSTGLFNASLTKSVIGPPKNVDFYFGFG